MDIRRTVPVKLAVTESDADLLRETIAEFRWSANYVVRHTRNEDRFIETSKQRLNDRIYDDVRAKMRLHANLVQAARSRAADALQSVVAKWKRGKKASLPRFTSPFLEYDKRRASMQQRGTRDAHEAMQSVGETETGRFEHLLHRVANGIVEEAVDGECSYIAFEDLTGICERLPRATWHHRWAFHRLYEYVEYKAERHGIEAVQVPPNHTSQRCTSCGFTHEDNRPSQDTFECLRGYANHADYKAVAG